MSSAVVLELLVVVEQEIIEHYICNLFVIPNSFRTHCIMSKNTVKWNLNSRQHQGTNSVRTSKVRCLGLQLVSVAKRFGNDFLSRKFCYRFLAILQIENIKSFRKMQTVDFFR